MAENTGISWTDATFNPWWGCQKVSPACDHCYAERDAKRFAPGKVLWGVGSERRTFDDKHWQQPLKWARRGFAACTKCDWRGEQRSAVQRDAHGETMPFCPECGGQAQKARRRVFCASMGDWLDLDAPLDEFVRLLDTIRLTPELHWLLLSKRIGNWRKRLQEALAYIESFAGDAAAEHEGAEALAGWVGNWLGGDAPANVWLGATVIDQAEADRDIPKLLAVPARVRFLSIEPMLGPINLADISDGHADSSIPREFWVDDFDTESSPPAVGHNALTGQRWQRFGEWSDGGPSLDWVICGGESGPKARPMHPDWARSLRDQCAAAGVPFHFKQWGEWAEQDGDKPTRTVRMDTDVGETLAARCDGFISLAGEFVRDMDDATTDDRYRGMTRVGKAAAGRLLDGIEHNGFPVASTEGRG